MPSTKVFGRPVFAVQVKQNPKNKKAFVLIPPEEKPFCIVKADTEFIRFEDDWEIVTQSGEKVHPSGRFYITAHTISPYHLVTDQA